MINNKIIDQRKIIDLFREEGCGFVSEFCG
jgi:hypothetical protein